MLKEINKGNMADGQFSSDTWKKMLATLNELSKRNFTMTQFKGKFNRTRLLHREFSTIINQDGFGWDVETNTIHALEESWQNYFQAHPKAKMFRTKGLSNYNLLRLIFNKSIATRVLHCASTQDPPNSDEENALEERLIHGGVHVNLESPTQDPIMAILKSDITTRLSKRPSDSCEGRPSKSKRELMCSQMNDALQSG
ncbi:L10-interacting MYB domain-containing protein-like [Quercus robur]|uniref:L10-interacting MYB domain-containing protein-like n=1 Tax=Quercus robur TaxID=38942 RepID=UPI0021628838|nr:L10-interacting MYB domain-containing protein-like [Quercus robur]